jgi:MEMO1 family protein
MIRQPSVSGKFYPSSKKGLEDQIKFMACQDAVPRDVLGVVVPHAGYIYSGPVACELFSNIEITDSVIILGPNHTGSGRPAAIYASGSWSTPLGDITIDEEISESICTKTKLIEKDASAHIHEHSLEVQIPIMQYFRADFKIIPIVLSSRSLKDYQKIAHAIAGVISDSGKRILIVASSDMTHYEPQESAYKKDNLAIDAILKLDEKLLIERVARHGITMCGYVPVAVMIACVKVLGAKTAKLLRYATSGDITGDHEAVVGYAGIMVE